MGYPNPSESDRGWGGGSDKWEIIDGKRTYPEWQHGLAFTGGKIGYAGEKCGIRQATIDFGKPKAFHKVIVWHHGYEHIPKECRLQYWDGAEWRDIKSERWVELKYAPLNGYITTPDIHTFKPVVGSKVRYLFDNCGPNMSGEYNEHGWLYEFEAFAPLPRIAYLPVSNIEGVGEVYTNKLGKQRIAVVKDLERINVDTLSERTGIPLYKLYVIKRRAELALSVKVDATLFKPLLDRRLDNIMRTSTEELRTITGQPSDTIDNLKNEISTLLLALDNNIVKNMLLEDLVLGSGTP